jgi:ZIP family zinc transporter
MLTAIGLGGLAAASLVVGALLAFARRWSKAQIGVVLAFGAGALISAVSVELVEEGLKEGGLGWTAVGLGAGALLVMLIDSMIPDARDGAGRVAGLVATLGFAVAAALSSLS